MLRSSRAARPRRAWAWFRFRPWPDDGRALRPEVDSTPASAAPAAPRAGAEVAITSEPDGAEIYIDGAYEGSTPSQLSMAAGEHHVQVTRPGYRDWVRNVRISAGAKKSINAILEKA